MVLDPGNGWDRDRVDRQRVAASKGLSASWRARRQLTSRPVQRRHSILEFDLYVTTSPSAESIAQVKGQKPQSHYCFISSCPDTRPRPLADHNTPLEIGTGPYLFQIRHMFKSGRIRRGIACSGTRSARFLREWRPARAAIANPRVVACHSGKSWRAPNRSAEIAR